MRSWRSVSPWISSSQKPEVHQHQETIMAWGDLFRELQEFDFTPEDDDGDNAEGLRLFDPDLDDEDWDEDDEDEDDDWD